ncbi:MAG TPA: 16S rRNA (cytosine(967)-C(5))-methyltransferase RsmB [Casimicrobiaceae bacterium]|jgi:16S rRNA (cytosine967-C5)-methyltransferase
MERAQRLAAKAVRRVLSGTPLPAALGTDAGLPAADHALLHELVYGTLRYLGQVRGIVRALADRPLSDASVEALLWVALYQLLHTGAAPYAVVDAAVDATGHLKKSSARGLSNAILRNFLRRRDAVLDEIARDDESRYSYPRWWIERLRADYGVDANAVLDAGNARAPLTLRINARQEKRDAYVEASLARGRSCTSIGEAGVVLTTAAAVAELPGYAEGAFSVQDAGAQLAAPLLDAHDGMRVLDACAAPGGKTTHIAERANVELWALDSDAGRLQRLTDNLARLRLDARVVHADAAQPAQWWDGVAFDRILLDAPCTASGVVRRHPDAKWLRRESDIASFCDQQRRLLDALWGCLRSGGRMLYVTCSLFRAENADQLRDFLARHPDASHLPLALPTGLADATGQLLPSGAGAEHNHDGFFYALLEKK